jgi:hypothetical protein
VPTSLRQIRLPLLIAHSDQDKEVMLSVQRRRVWRRTPRRPTTLASDMPD